MSAIDDVRNVMQDFLAPELRELKVRIDAVERQVEELKGSTRGQFEGLQKQFEHTERRAEQRHHSFEEQFQQAEHRAEKRHEDMMFLIRQGQEVRSPAERLAAVEEKLREVRH
jgi:ABC-type enterochelin transport system substrate-binding protein